MRFVVRFVLLLVVIIGFAYAIVWAFSFSTFPVTYGVTFSPAHASWLGLDWKKAYKDMLVDLKPPLIRVPVLWNATEPRDGEYHFADIDFVMNEAARHGAKVTLAIGQKGPRWPECHFPDWVKSETPAMRTSKLLAYVKTVVERYRNHKALDMWQVENEPFIRFEFGDCALFDTNAIYKEIAMVKSEDADHPVLVTDSGELGLWYTASKAGDLFGTTMYRMVGMPSGRFLSYSWLPAGAYRLRAKLLGIPYERFVVAELQAEPWIIESDPRQTSVATMEYTMNPGRLEKNLDYAEHTGASRVYLWGSEWWYWMKTEKKDARYWDLIAARFKAQKETQ